MSDIFYIKSYDMYYIIAYVNKDCFLHHPVKYSKSYAALNKLVKKVVGIFLKRKMIYNIITHSR